MPSRQVIRDKTLRRSGTNSGSAAPAPVLVLARTGFIIRNLLLGKFAEAVTAHRPLVATVPNPTDLRLLRVLGNQPIRLVEHFDIHKRLEDVRVPTLALTGDRDLLVSEESLNELCMGIQACRRVNLAGCGHLAFVTHPERVAKEVSQFLAE